MAGRVLILVAILVAGCSSSSPATSPGATSSSTGIPSAAASAGVVFERITVASAAPVDDALHWDAYPGAVDYVLVYSDIAGTAPGTWRGSGTAVRVVAANDGSRDTIDLQAGASYRWFVYATDDTGGVLASSEPQEFTCASDCP